HIGSSALSAVEGMMTVDADTPDRPMIYSDILGIGVIALPQGLAQPLIALAFLLCAVALFRAPRRDVALWRVLILPIAAILAGTIAAWAAGMVMGMIRAENAYGTAYPIALRGLFLATSLGVATLVARWLYRPEGADRHLAGAWAVMMALSLAASFAFFGSIVLFALPALLVVPGAALFIWGREGWVRRIAYLLFSLAAVLALTLVLTLHVLAEGALFVENSGPIMALVIWLFLVFLPPAWREPGSARRPLIAACVLAVGFAGLSLFVPAYTEDAPLGRNIVHFTADDVEGAYFLIDTRDPLPESMRDAMGFEISAEGEPFPNRWKAVAPLPVLTPATIDIVRDVVTDGRRTVELRLIAPDADWMRVFPDGEAPEVQSITVNGFRTEPDDGELPFLECTGRSCRDLQIVMEGLSADADHSLDIRTSRYGLDESADALLAARPNWITPQHDGDYRTHRRLLSVPVPTE
ncbi:MAG: hypothetical protein AAF449_18755, partial [Myxococcota bacterium]